MNTCSTAVENCVPGRNWVRFAFEVKGYDSRPVKNPPLGPWWEDCHGFGHAHVLVIAYIPLSSTEEEAEVVLKEYWPNAAVIGSKVEDTPRFTRNLTCPKWWKGDNLLASC